MANIMMILIGGAFFAMWYFFTYYFQIVLGYGPVKAGLAFFPMAVAIIIGAQISSRLIYRGRRAAAAAGRRPARDPRFLLALVDPTAQLLPGSHPRALLHSAFAMGLLFSPLAMAATSRVDRADAGLASGVLNTSRQVGGPSAWRSWLLSRPTSRHRCTQPASRSRGPDLGLPASLSKFRRSSTLVAFAITFALPLRHRSTHRAAHAS